MIVYFWKKSKILYAQWAILTLITILGLYMGFVWNKILLREFNTIQILRLENRVGVFNIQEMMTISPNTILLENQYVASKKGKYFYPSNCSKAKSLSIKNMLYYKDKMTAQASGYIEYLGCN